MLLIKLLLCGGSYFFLGDIIFENTPLRIAIALFELHREQMVLPFMAVATWQSMQTSIGRTGLPSEQDGHSFSYHPWSMPSNWLLQYFIVKEHLLPRTNSAPFLFGNLLIISQCQFYTAKQSHFLGSRRSTTRLKSETRSDYKHSVALLVSSF